MKLGELFIQLGVKGSTKELDKTIKQLEEAEKKSSRLIKYRKDLAKASSEEEKALIKKNFAQKTELENLNIQKKGLEQNKNSLMGVVKGIGAFVAGISLAYHAVDRMVNSLAVANSRMIAFQRQTGISFASLNKYASASASVNFNATPEQMANTMQNLASNLYDIRMGRGDISPYQELAFVGGKPFNPMGMNVEQLIESVREAIKGVDDVQATNIITRMGFSPDDLLMLRMTREELEKVQGLFLTAQEREQMNTYSLQLKKMQLQIQLVAQRLTLALMPAFLKITNKIKDLNEVWSKVVTDFTKFVSNVPNIERAISLIGVALMGLLAITRPLWAGFMAIYLVLEDLAYWYAGKGSLFGDIFGQRGTNDYAKSGMGKATNAIGIAKDTITSIWDIGKRWRNGELTGEQANTMAIDYIKNRIADPSIGNTNATINQNNNITINTSESAQAVQSTVGGYTNDIYTLTAEQIRSKSK